MKIFICSEEINIFAEVQFLVQLLELNFRLLLIKNSHAITNEVYDVLEEQEAESLEVAVKDLCYRILTIS